MDAATVPSLVCHGLPLRAVPQHPFTNSVAGTGCQDRHSPKREGKSSLVRREEIRISLLRYSVPAPESFFLAFSPFQSASFVFLFLFLSFSFHFSTQHTEFDFGFQLDSLIPSKSVRLIPFLSPFLLSPTNYCRSLSARYSLVRSKDPTFLCLDFECTPTLRAALDQLRESNLVDQTIQPSFPLRGSFPRLHDLPANKIYR